MAIVTAIDGKVSITEDGLKREIKITDEENLQEKSYIIPFGSSLKVKENQMVKAGDPLTEGSIDPHDILSIQGVRAVQDYLLKEVQRVYRSQGVDINDKHIELIVHQMLRKKKIKDPGDSTFLEGTSVDAFDIEEEQKRLREEGLNPITAEQELKGITKASLATDSFLSAASFQETTKVLTESSILGKVDKLKGLKENVIIGHLIPAGTGLKTFRNTMISTQEGEDEDRAAEQFIADPTNIEYEAKEFKVVDDDLNS